MTDPISRPEAELEKEAARIRAWIELSARDARRDPTYARQHGIVPVAEIPLFETGAGPTTSEAAWLRGAVQALMPSGWSYQVVEEVGGRAQLFMTGYNPLEARR